MSRPGRWAWAVAALVFLAYAAVLRHGFVSWDDDGFLYQNPYFRGLDWAHLRWMFTSFLKGPYQPIVWLSYALDYLLWGMDPAGFHLTSLLWHCANAALLYLFAFKLFRRAAPESDPAACAWAAGFAALSFALHPLRVEPVAWATARRDLMSGSFFLCALLCHLEGRDPWTFICYCLSLLAKPMGIGLPLVLAVLDSTILRRPVRWKTLALYLLPAAAASGLAWHGQAVAGATRSAAAFSWPQRSAQACYAHAFFLVKTLWPTGLAPMYQAALNIRPLEPRFLASAALSFAVAGTAFGLRRRLPAVWAAWLGYLILLAPVLGVVKFGSQLVADRYSYLPALPLSLLAAAGLLMSQRRRWPVLAAAVLVALFWSLTLRQLGFWKDSESLYCRVLSVDPGQATAHNNLGLVYEQEGRLEDARRQFDTALKLRPGFASAHNNLGTLMLKAGRLAEAEAEFHSALDCDPGTLEAYNNLGLILAHRKQYQQALGLFETALRIDPGYRQAAENRALVLRRLRGEPR